MIKEVYVVFIAQLSAHHVSRGPQKGGQADESRHENLTMVSLAGCRTRKGHAVHWNRGHRLKYHKIGDNYRMGENGWY